MVEFIDQKECSTFELMMLYIMCYLKEDDLNDDMTYSNFMPLGEMETYLRFGIEWGKCKQIQDLVNLNDTDKRWELENKFQDVAESARELYNYIKSHNY